MGILGHELVNNQFVCGWQAVSLEQVQISLL
jgi:hypothetical protein